LKIYGPQVGIAGQTLCSTPTSKITKENFEAFVEMWTALMDDLHSLANDVGDVCRRRAAAEKPVYMSLPRPGVSTKQLFLLTYVCNQNWDWKKHWLMQDTTKDFIPCMYYYFKSGQVRSKLKLL